jgi:hypothetical protein
MNMPMENSGIRDCPVPSFSTPAVQRPRSKSRGKGNLADQFCIYSTNNGSGATLIMEYKAPHKLPRKMLKDYLQGEIWPDRDIINKENDDADKELRLTIAVVVQLFSYMIQ